MELQQGQDLNALINSAQEQENSEQKPIDVIVNLAEEEAKGKEVSLSTLKESEKKKIMDAYIQARDVAKNYYSDTVESKIQKRWDLFIGTTALYKKKFPRLSETSNFVSKDIQTAINWLMPGFMDAFTGTDDPVEIKGVNVEDDSRAKKTQELLSYQLTRKNNYTQFMDTIQMMGLAVNMGVAKVYWKREEDRKAYKIMISDDQMDIILALEDAVAKGEAEITKVEAIKEAPNLRMVYFDKISTTANHPVIAYLPPNEFIFTPDAANIQEAKFAGHRKLVSGDYLKRREQEGLYKDVDKAMAESSKGDTTTTSWEDEKNIETSTIHDRLEDNDTASTMYELIEGYIAVDYNNDGVYEHLIVHAIGDTPIRIAENELKIKPFFINEAVPDAETIFPEDRCFTDVLEQLQDVKTALIRQVITIISKNNSPQTFVDDEKVDMDALIDNQELIPTKGRPQDSVMQVPQLNLSPTTMELINYCQNEVESQSGSTKYNQGMDSNSLNKTATGITAIMGAAEKRSIYIARLMAQNFLVPMFKYIILLNQKYLDDETMFRLTNENVSIKKEDLDVDFDFIVNVGAGAGTKEAKINYLMVAMNSILPLLQQQGLVNEKTWFAISKQLFENMGIRTVGNNVLDPNDPQVAQMLQQKAQQQMQIQQAQTQQIIQAQMQLQKIKSQADIEKAKVPHTSVSYKDLPGDAKVGILRSYGVDTTPQAVQAKEVIDHA